MFSAGFEAWLGMMAARMLFAVVVTGLFIGIVLICDWFSKRK